jgi:hypothetical protein
MTTIEGYRVVSEVRHRLALGLNYLDAITGAPVVGEIDATIEAIDGRNTALLMLAKPGGAVIVLTRRVAALFRGIAGSTAQTLVRLTPRAWPEPPLPRNRAVLPRRFVLPVVRNADGLPVAEAPGQAGKWVFDVPLYRGGSAMMAPGATILSGQLVYPNIGGTSPEPVRWAQVIGLRAGTTNVLGGARTDDRGEFSLLIAGRAEQTPNAIAPVSVALQIWGPPQRPDPLALRADPFADVPIEPWLVSPPPPYLTPPPGYVAAPLSPAHTAVPGRVKAIGQLVFTP